MKSLGGPNHELQESDLCKHKLQVKIWEQEAGVKQRKGKWGKPLAAACLETTMAIVAAELTVQSQLVANDCGGWSRHCWSQRKKWLLRKPEITSCEEEGSLSRPALEARFLGGR